MRIHLTRIHLSKLKTDLLRREVVGTIAASVTLLGVYVAIAPTVMTFLVEQSLGMLVSAHEKATSSEQVFVSPAKLGDATFTEDAGFLDTTVTLEIHDYSAPDGKPLDWGMVSDMSGQGIWPKKAYWTKDGTVFVLADFNRMYDFKRHLSYPPEEFVIVVKKPPFISYDLKKFIATRGGEGPNLLKGK